MRYKTIEVPPEQLASSSSDEMLLLTAVLGTLIGLFLVILGKKGKQLWMWIWDYGLVLSSVYLGVTMHFGITLFGHF